MEKGELKSALAKEERAKERYAEPSNIVHEQYKESGIYLLDTGTKWTRKKSIYRGGKKAIWFAKKFCVGFAIIADPWVCEVQLSLPQPNISLVSTRVSTSRLDNSIPIIWKKLEDQKCLINALQKEL